MALVITATSADITFAWDSTFQDTYSKDDLIVHLEGNFVKFGVEENHLHKVLYSNVSTPTYGSAAAFAADLIALKNSAASSMQVFVATAGQTVFTPVVAPNAQTMAEVGGSIYSVGSGISQDGTSVTFAMGRTVGEIVIIRNF